MINLKKWMTKVVNSLTTVYLNSTSLVTSGDYIDVNLVHVHIYGGRFCKVYVRGTAKSAMTANTPYANCMQLANSLLPADACFISMLNNGSGNLIGTGSVQLRPQGAVASGATVYISSAMYVLATPYEGGGNS